MAAVQEGPRLEALASGAHRKYLVVAHSCTRTPVNAIALMPWSSGGVEATAPAGVEGGIVLVERPGWALSRRIRGAGQAAPHSAEPSVGLHALGGHIHKRPAVASDAAPHMLRARLQESAIVLHGSRLRRAPPLR